MTKKIIYIIYTLILLGTTLGFAQGAKGNGGDQTTATRLLQAGDKFYDQRLYTASMKSYLDGLRIAEHQGYSELTARFYNGMGNLYSTQGDYQMGLYFYRKALRSSRKTGQKTLQNAVLNNLVGASCFVGQADSGMVFLQQMEANVEHNCGYRYNILMGRGLVAKSQDQPAAAASYYIQARQYAIRAGMDSSFVDNTNSCLAQLYMDTHRLDSAILLLKKNEEWARRTNHDEFLAETMHLLAQAYDAQGDATRASTCRMEYANLMEKLHYGDELNAMKNTQYIYDANKNASTINLLTQQQIFDSQQIRTQARWLLALAIALALIIVLFIIVSAQKRQPPLRPQPALPRLPHPGQGGATGHQQGGPPGGPSGRQPGERPRRQAEGRSERRARGRARGRAKGRPGGKNSGGCSPFADPHDRATRRPARRHRTRDG